MRENILMIINMETENTFMLMEDLTMGNGGMARRMEKEGKILLVVILTMVIG
jgi:hypothetical protein